MSLELVALALWGSTLALSVATLLWRWLRRQPLPESAWLFALRSAFYIIASTALTQHALRAVSSPSGPASLQSWPDLSLFYLALHYLLVVWQLVGDLLPAAFHLPAAWPMLFLYTSYLYYRIFFALELGISYPVLYAMALGLLLLRPAGLPARQPPGQSLFRPGTWSPRLFLSLSCFLLLAGISTVFSAAPGESIGQILQICCFALLPFLLARDLWPGSSQAMANGSIWRAAAAWLVMLGGGVWVLLAGVKLAALIRDLGLGAAVRYRLFIADIGANWVSYFLVALFPLSLGFALATTDTRRKLLWSLTALGMFLSTAYTQSSSGYNGWIGIASGVAILALLLKWSTLVEWWRQHAQLRPVVTVAGVTIILILMVAGIYVADRINSYSLYTRLYGWRTMLHQVTDHPLLGSGLAVRHVTARYGDLVSWGDVRASSGWLNQQPLSQTAQQLQLGYHAHNLFLELANGAGLPAFLAFLWFLWELLRHGLAAFRRADGPSRILIAGCVAGIVASLGWGLIDVMEYSPPFFTTPVWVLIGLLLAAPGSERPEVDHQAPGRWITALFSRLAHERREDTHYSARLGQCTLRLALCVVGLALVLVAIVGPLAGNMHYRAAYAAYQERRWEMAADDLVQAAHWEPLNAKYYQLLGEASINLGRYAEAVSAYERAIGLKRDFAPYHAQLAWLYWLQGDLAQATAHLETAVQMDPLEAWRKGLHADLGLAYVAQGRLEQALPLFKETIELDPQMVSADYWLPSQAVDGAADFILDPIYQGGPSAELEKRILVHLGRANQTRRSFDLRIDRGVPSSILCLSRVLDLVEADYQAAHAVGDRAAPRLLATAADAARRAGLDRRAERAYLLFQESFPESSYGFRDLGALYREQGRLQQAQAMLERAVQIRPRDAESWQGLAQVYLDRGMPDRAIQALDIVHRLDPLDARLYDLRAQSFQANNHPAQWADQLRRSLFIQESIPNRLQLAGVYYQLQKPRQATEQCLRAMGALRRTWPRPWAAELWEIGLCLAELDPDAMPGELTALVDQDPEIGNVLLGHVHRARAQWDTALAAYQAAAGARPDEAAPHYFLGETYQALGQPGLAVDQYCEAAQLDPLESLPLLALGRLQWAQGQQEAALESFRAAIEATPGWGQAQAILGNALLALGDRGSAGEHYRLAQIADRDAQDDLAYDLTADLAEAEITAPGSDYVKNDYFAIDGDRRRVLFMHPDSRARYTIQVPKSAILAFDLATSPESWQQPGDGVTFSVYVDSKRGLEQLFSTYLDPKRVISDRHWHPHTVHLGAYAGQTVTLILETAAGPAGDARYDWAGWGAPRLLAPQAGSRP